MRTVKVIFGKKLYNRRIENQFQTVNVLKFNMQNVKVNRKTLDRKSKETRKIIAFILFF